MQAGREQQRRVADRRDKCMGWGTGCLQIGASTPHSLQGATCSPRSNRDRNKCPVGKTCWKAPLRATSAVPVLCRSLTFRKHLRKRTRSEGGFLRRVATQRTVRVRGPTQNSPFYALQSSA